MIDSLIELFVTSVVTSVWHCFTLQAFHLLHSSHQTG